MNIEKTQLNNAAETNNIKPAGKNDFGMKFSDELNELKNNVKEPIADQKADLKNDKANQPDISEKGDVSEKDLTAKATVEEGAFQILPEKEILINKNKQNVNIEEEKTLKKTPLAQNNPFQNKITPEEIIKNLQPENPIENDENKIIQKPEISVKPEINIKPIIEENIIPEIENKIEEKPIVQEQNTIQEPEIDTKPNIEQAIKPEINIKPIIEENIILEPENKVEEKPIVQEQNTVQEPKIDNKPDIEQVIKPEINIKPIIEENIIPEPENIVKEIPIEQEIKVEEKPIVQEQNTIQEPKIDTKPNIEQVIKPEINTKPIVEENIIPEPENIVKEKPIIQPQEIVKTPEVDIKQNIEEPVKPEKNAETKEVIAEPKNIIKENIQTTPDKNEHKQENQDDELGIHIAIADIKNIVNRIKQTDKKKPEKADLKTDKENSKEDKEVINNDFKINEQDKLPQMMPNMNFTGDGQPFSSFVNQEEQQQNSQKLSLNKADLEEEAKILSTMEENIQIANKNINKNKQVQQTEILKPENIKVEKEPDKVEEKVVSRNDGVKKIDTKTGVTIENIVKYDTVVVTKEDADLFIDIVNQGEVNLNDYSQETVNKASQISKTLADMLAKAKENNQPLRIDFDNNISIIIKVSRDGKISADFLPSSQVAETYLKENLPLLKQRFDENNIDYDELNQRERRNPEREDRQRKDKNHE